MKKLILVFAFFLSLSTIQSQTAKELIKKMQASIQQLKSIRFEMDKAHYSSIDSKQQFKMKADIVFDTITTNRPTIKNLNCVTIENANHTQKISNKLFTGKKLVTIKEYTREINIEAITKDNLNDKLIDFQMEIFPYFEASAISYLDSLLNPDFKNDYINRENFSYEVTTDTACLSGDCYLVKMISSIDMTVGIADDTNEESTMINYKKEINSFWINKKTFFLERYCSAWNLANDSAGIYDDYRFTKIFKDVKIDNAIFEFNKKKYTSYRIDEETSKGIFTTQEAFVKAPNIKGVSAEGDSINLYQNKAKLYLIDFWFTNCPTCINAKVFIEKEIIPNYSNLEIMVIGVNPIDKSFVAVEKALKEETPVYHYILNKEVAKEYHLSAYPGIYLLNSRFEVIRSYNSFSERVQQELTELIHQHLK